MKPFRLVPDLPPQERARKKNAMLDRLEKEKLVKIEANVGAGPELAVKIPTAECPYCKWTFTVLELKRHHDCWQKKKHEASRI